MPRVATCKVIDLAENEVLSWEDLARECLERMSEDEVADMGHELGWLDDDEEDEDDDDEEEDETVDLQRQAHVKLADGREFAFWVLHETFDNGDDIENLRTYITGCLLNLQIDAKEIAGFEIINESALCEWLDM